MRGTILLGLASALLTAACASTGGDKTPCASLVEACHAQCDKDFEQNPSSWDYQSCIASCQPDPGAICAR